MKRYQTRVTVWPAIADLMTAVVVGALLIGALVYFSMPPKPSPPDTLEISSDSLLLQMDTTEWRKYKDRMRATQMRAWFQLRMDTTEWRNHTSYSHETEVVAFNFPQMDTTEWRNYTAKLDVQNYIDTLVQDIQILHYTVSVLRDSIIEIVRGVPNCLGENVSLMTVRFDVDDYYVELNDYVMESDWTTLKDYVNRFDQRMLNPTEMITFATELDAFGDERRDGCHFFVEVKNGGMSQDSLWLRWRPIAPYFGGATNPRIFN